MFYCKHESYCIAEARSALQIWKARVCMAEAHGVRGFPPSPCIMHISYIDTCAVYRCKGVSVLSPVHFKKRADILPAIASCTVHKQIIPGKTGQYTKCTSYSELYSTHTDYKRQNWTVQQINQHFL